MTIALEDLPTELLLKIVEDMADEDDESDVRIAVETVDGEHAKFETTMGKLRREFKRRQN